MTGHNLRMLCERPRMTTIHSLRKTPVAYHKISPRAKRSVRGIGFLRRLSHNTHDERGRQGGVTARREPSGRMGLVEPHDEGYRLVAASVRSFGDTLEWFVAALLEDGFQAEVLCGGSRQGSRARGRLRRGAADRARASLHRGQVVSAHAHRPAGCGVIFRADRGYGAPRRRLLRGHRVAHDGKKSRPYSRRRSGTVTGGRAGGSTWWRGCAMNYFTLTTRCSSSTANEI